MPVFGLGAEGRYGSSLCAIILKNILLLHVFFFFFFFFFFGGGGGRRIRLRHVCKYRWAFH